MSDVKGCTKSNKAFIHVCPTPYYIFIHIQLMVVYRNIMAFMSPHIMPTCMGIYLELQTLLAGNLTIYNELAVYKSLAFHML